MALELPDWLTTAFGVIGLPWPGVDEDTLHDWATGVRQFADDIVDNSSRANQTMRELADSSESSSISAAVGALERHHQLLVELHGPIHDFAEALDIAADAVVAQKWVVIGAATALAAEFTATQIGAIFSLGADEAAVPAEVISTRTIVKFALQTLGNELLGKLIGLGAQEVSDHIGASIARMFEEGLKVQGEEQSLKFSYEAIHAVAQEIRGHANTAEDIGKRAHSQNTSRDLADNSGGGGWGEVIKQLERGLLDVAGDLFKSLPGTIAHVLRDIADFLEKLVAKFKRADEEGSPAVAAGGAEPAISGTGREPGAGQEPLAPGKKEPVPVGADGKPGTEKPPSECRGEGDPVDVATGDVILTETDVTLPGLLPLVLERAHRSSRRTGRWFGQSWISSLDQRLVLTSERIYAAFADGRILTWTPQDAPDDSALIPLTGAVWPLVRKPDGSYTVSDPQRGLTWRFERRAGYEIAEDGQGELPLVSVTDRVGHEIVFSYDAAGRPLSVTHSGGYRVLVTVADERVTALTLAGRDGEDDIPLRQFEYDTDGNLSGVINSSGLTMRFTYDDAGRMTSWTDRNDYSYRYTFDDQGHCIRCDGPDGMMSGTLTYEPGVTRWTDADGAITTYKITDSGEIAAIIDPLGNTARWDHDSRGNVTTHIDPLNRITRYAYDDHGNLLTITRPDGSQIVAEYDEQSQPLVLTEPNGGTWLQEYDERGNRTSLTSPDGAVSRFGYDGQGHLAMVISPDDAETRITCDSAGLPVEVTGPDGARTRYVVDGLGRIKQITGPDDSVTRLKWTVEGKLTARTFPDGATETWSWDGEGNLVRHSSTISETTRYEYGPFDRLTATQRPDGTRSEFRYSRELRVTEVLHGGQVWSYDYDRAGRLVSETDYNGATTTYTYDQAGQLTRQVNAVGQEITFGYDPLGNLTDKTADGTLTTFGYDMAGRLRHARNPDADVTWSRDSLGRVIGETCNDHTVTSEYDAVGRLTRRVTPVGHVADWEFDHAGQPTGMTVGEHEFRFGYDLAGRETSRDLPGGLALTQEWDRRGRLTAQSLAMTGQPQSEQLLQRRAYSYRSDGLPERIHDLLAGNRTLTLDAVGRVTAVTGPNWAETYAYDQAGNLTSAARPLLSSGPTATLPDADSQGQHQISGTLVTRAGNIRYRYDRAGRVISRQRTRISRKPETWHYEWNADNRLTAVTTPDRTTWRYRYDPIGRRIAKQGVAPDGGVLSETRFIWDGPVLAEQTELTAAGGQVTTWDYLPGTFTPLTQTSRTSLRETPQAEIDQQFYAIISDLTGTPAELVGADGTLVSYQQHTLWGSTVWHPPRNSTPLRFPGQYEDPETGLHYNQQRYYDPVIGAYLSPDPLGLSPAPNPHAYVPNPHVEIDPLGLSCQSGGGNDAAPQLGSERAYSVAYETKLPDNLYPGRSRGAHFQAANKDLVTAMDRDPGFAAGMERLIPGIRKNLVGLRGGISRNPPSELWTWHHAPEPGVMQLVPRIQHTAAGPLQNLFHPGGIGGFSIWG